MIKVSVLYPNGKDVQFDATYYRKSHLPMIAKAVGTALKGMELDFGIGSRISTEPAPYVAIVHLKFNDLASFQAAFSPHSEMFAADLVNYSNVKGILQISELIEF